METGVCQDPGFHSITFLSSMFKKKLSIAVISFALFSGVGFNAFAQQEAITETSEQVVATTPDGQTEVVAPGTDSEEVNTISESETTRRMLQEEKAKDLSENDSTGGAVTIIAMVIVLSALVILSVLFLGFGKISSKLLSKKKKEAISAAGTEDHHDHEDLESGEIIAAISAALAEHFGQGHDMEDTILTIRAMKRAYSPWNSKNLQYA